MHAQIDLVHVAALTRSGRQVVPTPDPESFAIPPLLLRSGLLLLLRSGPPRARLRLGFGLDLQLHLLLLGRHLLQAVAA